MNIGLQHSNYIKLELSLQLTVNDVTSMWTSLPDPKLFDQRMTRKHSSLYIRLL